MREDRYEAHPLAELVPPMADEEYGALVADIAAHGLHEPIVLHEGRILDGRHRYRACLEAGVPPRFRTYEGDSPAGFVLSQNLHRRHLTPGQRAALALAVKPHLEAEARRRQQEAGRYGIEGGRGHRKIVRRWQPSTSVALIVTVTAGGTGRRSTNVSARPGFE